ncbi:hypothetical protein BC832DRAFT_226986 [Gaertneriomyces semiglobifer]|nr:hypothetical protein BC832DRAFT_226986 [Gaertneriomyces semiglobifer]
MQNTKRAVVFSMSINSSQLFCGIVPLVPLALANEREDTHVCIFLVPACHTHMHLLFPTFLIPTPHNRLPVGSNLCFFHLFFILDLSSRGRFARVGRCQSSAFLSPRLRYVTMIPNNDLWI